MNSISVSQAQSISNNSGTQFSTSTQDFVRRSLDLLFATTGLIITTPLLPFVALIIKLDSKGPVFFLQERIGQDGKAFQMRKLRSMHLPENRVNPDDPTMRDDRAVTRVGHVLRRFSIDELPQLIHILRGEMSVVGPRPLPSGSVDLQNLDWQTVLSRKPGLTSPGTIKARKLGYEIDPKERLRLDSEYVERKSVIEDLIVLLKTITVFFRGR